MTKVNNTSDRKNSMGCGMISLLFFIGFCFVFYEVNKDDFHQKTDFHKTVDISNIHIINESNVSTGNATRFAVDIDISDIKSIKTNLEDYALRIGKYYVQNKSANAVSIYFVLYPNIHRITRYQYVYAPFGEWSKASMGSNYKLSKIKEVTPNSDVEQIILSLDKEKQNKILKLLNSI
ncbi:MAG: hypothetical protein KC646_10115 [Candidatus Cloacimonetes bacterium]|nr:hypothetical protein [Candidatus Cloacimonadota bacterium]